MLAPVNQNSTRSARTRRTNKRRGEPALEQFLSADAQPAYVVCFGSRHADVFRETAMGHINLSARD